MTLAAGIRLGSYEIIALLGSGGMGDVYRARDARLGRDVALKILPAAVSDDPDRLARFEREARALASLNHPNIATIHGLEEGPAEAGRHVRAIVLELIEGQTLADRLAQGALPAKEALAIAHQIADALDAAHERGIVHRDLKPSNVAVTPDGRVKVLDFGLAKLTAASAAEDASGATTLEADTRAGVILGTAPYMSPEQARGQDVDKRADIWAFGCVAYEMLTGRRAFDGPTLTDTLAAIVEREPDWSALPRDTSPGVTRLLRRCLAKDPRRRLRDIGDARIELEELSHAEVHAPLLRYRTRGALPWTVAAALAAALIATVFVPRMARDVPAVPPLSHLSIELGGPFLNATAPLAISPDGAYVAYQTVSEGREALYLRSLSDPQPRLVAASGRDPFFSPDSQWLGFVADGRLKKMPVRGGPAVTLADAPGARGASWNEDGVIVFAPISRGGLSRVPAAGGATETLTVLDEKRGETSHRQPVWLADGRTVVYRAERADGAALMAMRPGMPPKELIPDAARPVALPGHRLAFQHADRLLVQAVDPETLTLTGTPETALAGVAAFAVSASGTLVYAVPQAQEERRLVWVDRKGAEQTLAAATEAFSFPRLSPDGRRVLLSLDGRERNIWIYDIASASLAPLTSDGVSIWADWADGGRRVVYSSNRPGTLFDLFSRPTDGGAERPVVQRPLIQAMPSVAGTGMIAYMQTEETTGQDLWLMAPEGSPKPLVATRATEAAPALSADGRWLAYTSNESGTTEVYVRGTSDDPARWPISTGGGVEPVWAGSGRELFYRNGSEMWAVQVEPGTTLTIGRRQMLFDKPFQLGSVQFADYDVTADATRFIMIGADADAGRVSSLNVIQHWLADLDRRVR